MVGTVQPGVQGALPSGLPCRQVLTKPMIEVACCAGAVVGAAPVRVGMGNRSCLRYRFGVHLRRVAQLRVQLEWWEVISQSQLVDLHSVVVRGSKPLARLGVRHTQRR
jgi:hypothetical protein